MAIIFYLIQQGLLHIPKIPPRTVCIKVLSGFRINEAVYIQGDTIEVSPKEAKQLTASYPEVFERV